MINLTNRDNLQQFVVDNIAEYNAHPTNFTAKNLKTEIMSQLHENEEAIYTDSEIGVYLAERLRAVLSDQISKAFLDNQLYALEGNKTAIGNGLKRIANAEILSVNDIEKYYESLIMNRIQNTFENSQEFKTIIIETILTYNNFAEQQNQSSHDQIKYIKNDLKYSVDKALYLALGNGFTNKRIDVNTGTKAANDGDSAQFLFLARAVLAGYNCSNVDVRSSRYDAVIDFNGHLLRVQVKGISKKEILLKDRDRGGAGIDPTARRNRGRYITSADADIYVAVDKQFGTCYLIPTTDIDDWVAEGIKSINLSNLADYKENWDIIASVAHNIFPI